METSINMDRQTVHISSSPLLCSGYNINMKENSEKKETEDEEKDFQPLKSRYASDITMVGDLSTIREVVILLSFIRNIIDEGREADISVKVGHNIKSGSFNFALNNQEVPDIRAKEQISIN